MLPELLFSGGNSMQDISRDELTLLQSGCDKDSILASSESTFDRIKLGRTPELESLPVSIKLEDTAEAFPWHTASTDIGSNLLRHSDDPLISGALDDNQNEFDTIANCEPLSIEPPSKICAYKKPVRTRKKGQIKLRFHHQALPQEYLEHYEATQNQILSKEIALESNTSSKSKKDRNMLMCEPTIEHLQEQKINESVQMWLQKVSEFQEEKHLPVPNLNNEYGIAINKSTINQSNNTIASKKNARVVTYNDLPYMGEMTLENSKPRRGRKPKKADICHLIYKNYGTVFPNQQQPQPKNDDCASTSVPANSTDMQLKSSVQNKIISSLLEKRLTQSNASKTESQHELSDVDDKSQATEEPLNLCMRDRYDCDMLTIISSEDANESERFSDFKSDVDMVTPTDLNANPLFSSNLKMALPNFQSALLDNKFGKSEVAGTDKTDGLTNSSGYAYWPNTGVFLHPMALYLHKIADASSAYVQSQTDESTMLSVPIESRIVDIQNKTPSPRPRQQQSLLVPKKITQLLKDDANSCATSPSLLTASPNPSSKAHQKNFRAAAAPPKRKRSAIFIPPVPEESSTNHATEVSICKFKFTGGAKPSLQEKKMLSVDAGGNFRYYSGTGDKSIRGYEFFPRESLQQSSLLAGSSAGAFLNTTGKKIPNDLPPPSLGLSNELLQIPEISPPNGVGFLPLSSTSSSTAAPTTLMAAQRLNTLPHQLSHGNNSSQNFNSRRKRKSKRSMQREKLEKTFKEKGFLIQTQQLESAEGATYCKFRQLRKFTRYLFRSWKDYLPGELQQSQTNATASSTISSTAVHAPIENCNDEAEPSISSYLPSPAPSYEDQ